MPSFFGKSKFYGDHNHYYEKIGNRVTDITEDVPYEIPRNWMWVRAKEICINIFSGKTPKYSKNENKNIIIGQAANVGRKIDFTFSKFGDSTFWDNMDDKYFLQYGDILLNSLGNGTIGRCGINLTTTKMLSDGHLIIFRIENLTTSLFVFIYLTLIRNEIESSAVGTTNQIFLKLSMVENYLIPLPPLAEQQRIVDKLEELDPYISEYERLVDENEQLDKEFPEKLKQSILQYAMQGKLVKQDPNDEPASVLLEKIKQEKEKLIKEGKVKKDKNESIIYRGDDKNYYEKIGNNVTDITDEIPFEIPDSWRFTRIQNVSQTYTGNSINAEEKQKKYTNVSNGYNYIGTKDVGFDGTICYENGVRIPFNTDFRIAHKGSTLLCIEGGSAGHKIGLLNQDVCFGNKLCTFEPFCIDNEFLYYYLQSPALKESFQKQMSGIIGGVSADKIKQLMVPLPPLAEQTRISNKIKLIFLQL